MNDPAAPPDGEGYRWPSCGRCYLVECVPGTVVDRYGEQLSRWDTCRRREAETGGLNGSGFGSGGGWGGGFGGGGGGGGGFEPRPRAVVIKVVDACPCVHPNSASNARWCCSDQPHIDLGEQAFAYLADLDKGVVRARWREVECATAGNGPVVLPEGGEGVV